MQDKNYQNKLLAIEVCQEEVKLTGLFRRLPDGGEEITYFKLNLRV